MDFKLLILIISIFNGMVCGMGIRNEKHTQNNSTISTATKVSLALFVFLLVFLISLEFFNSFFFESQIVINRNIYNHSLSGFANAIATWYGPPNGVSTGGACGYDTDVAKPPYSGLITAGNPILFKKGKGCGKCYLVKCTGNAACSGSPVTVTLVDSCPGCDGRVHFDLSGIAFGAMAKTGQADQLRNAGKINVLYHRVSCRYPKHSVQFKVDKGSNPSYFAALIEYSNGYGNIGTVEIRPSNSKSWFPMEQLWGATYKFSLPTSAKPPFSIRMTQHESKRRVVAKNVIPVNWKPGGAYQSNIYF